MNFQRILLSLYFCVFALSGFSQNGRIISKVPIGISNSNFGDELFTYQGDSLRNEYKYVYDVEMYAIDYESDGLEIEGFIIEPKSEGKFPVIIFNRGGNNHFAALDANRLISASLAYIASKGYVVIASNYRQNDEYGGKDINDVLSLFESIKEIDKIDTNRIGMFGWSRGGMMTYQVLSKTTKIKTAIIASTPSNLFDVVAERPAVENDILSKQIPNYWDNRDEELRKRSVIYWADELCKSTRMLILCGTQDRRVNPDQTDSIAVKLNEYGYDFEVKKFDTDHSFRSKNEELKELLIDWFDKNL